MQSTKHPRSRYKRSKLILKGLEEFKKVNWELHEYANEWFREAREDVPQNITRRPKKQRMDHTTTCTSAEMEMFTHKQFSKRLSIPSKPPVSPAHISVGYTRPISEARINRAGIVKAKTDARGS
ncbi:hypothetical protein Tco_0897056 [Tanacetum coccineum]